MLGSLIGTGLGALGSIWGGNKAGKAMQGAANQANGVLTDTYNQGLGYFQPYQQAGGNALSQLNALNSGDYSGFNQSPDYLWAQQQGMQGLDRSAAARGALYSGGHTADTLNYNQGLATQNLGNYRNSLMGLAGMGQNAAGSMASLGANYGANYGNNLMAGAQGRASAYTNTGNMLAGLGAYAGDMWGGRR